jgi:hypothetical protein
MTGATRFPAIETGHDGIVVGSPRRWLRVEGATLLLGAVVAFSTTHQAWWLIPAVLLLPDLFMAGYFKSTRVGAHLYNLVHVTPLPAIVIALGWHQHHQLLLALGLVWLAHIGMDRVLGYGLKYDDDFQHTHLGRIGSSEPRGA